MSGNKVKVSVLEVNGVEEEEGPCERLLQAGDIDVDDTTLQTGFDDLQNVLENIVSGAGDSCVGGAGATYVFLPSECVGGEAA